MIHCGHCGLVSDDHRRCTWCGAILESGSVPVVREISPPTKRYGAAGWLGGLAVLLLVFLLFARRGSADDAASAASPRIGAESGAGLPIPISGTRVPNRRDPTNRAATKAATPSGESTGADPGASGSPTTGPSPETLEPSEESIPEATGQDADPVPVAGVVRLIDARLAIGEDEDGQGMAGGRVIILNEGPYPVTSFRVTMVADGVAVELRPFSGSPDSPMPWTDFRIEAGRRVEIPVMTPARFGRDPVETSYRVVLRATIDGPPGTVSDSVTIPAGA